jgi:hypothetical protein
VRLTQRYDLLLARAAEGDPARAEAAFYDLVGLTPRHTPAVAERVERAALIRYDAPRRVDLVALRRGARSIAKFEDLPRAVADALARRLTAEGLRTRVEGPYARRFDAALSVDGAGDRYSVIAARGGAADALAEAERDRSADGARRAGALLGYPPCCVEAFLVTARGADAARDGVNEACLRALADAGPTHWSLHPMSHLSPVAFAPCHGRCPRAMAFARKVFDAVRAEDPSAAETIRRTLATPILALRVSLFWALVGAMPHHGQYTRAVMHDDGTAPRLADLAARLFGAALAHGDAVALTDDALTVTLRGAETARWHVRAPRTPRLLTFDADPAW